MGLIPWYSTPVKTRLVIINNISFVFFKKENTQNFATYVLYDHKKEIMQNYKLYNLTLICLHVSLIGKNFMVK